MSKRLQVLIVGGGPVGMGFAIELGLRGISSAIVDAAPSLTASPRVRI